MDKPTDFTSDVINNKESNQNQSDSSEENSTDPVNEWLYLIISLLLTRGDLYELFVILSPSTSSSSSHFQSQSNTHEELWYNIISHEQV